MAKENVTSCVFAFITYQHDRASPQPPTGRFVFCLKGERFVAAASPLGATNPIGFGIQNVFAFTNFIRRIYPNLYRSFSPAALRD